MKQVFFIILSVLIMISCSKENELSSIVVVNDTLSGTINDDNIYSVTSLTINGTISGEDWYRLSEMAFLGKLEVLDMTNAKIAGLPDSDLWHEDEIPEKVFYKSKSLKEVHLPSTLKVVSEEAFAECNKLSVVHFPENIDSIGPRAFHKSPLSGEFKTPTNLRVIARQAFARTQFTKIIVSSDIIAGKTVTRKEDENGKISDYALIYTLGGNSVFAYCENLSEVIVDEGCTMLDIGFEHCSSLSKVSLPSTLRQIGQVSGNNGNYVFKDCAALESIILPYDLLSIGYNTFAYSSIKEISIPNRVNYLGTSAFQKCTQLKTVKMPHQLKQIAYNCFEGCSSLTEIEIQGMGATIGNSAFAGCSALKSILLEIGVIEIGNMAFKNCISLQSVLLPNYLSSLGESAFEGCSNLSTVRIPDSLKKIELTTFKDCTELRNIVIGSSIKSIGTGAFFHCAKLENINLPASVSSIASYAFAYTSIKRMRVNNSYPLPVSDNAFYGVNLLKATLEVPAGAALPYQNSAVWMDFGRIEEFE